MSSKERKILVDAPGVRYVTRISKKCFLSVTNVGEKILQQRNFLMY